VSIVQLTPSIIQGLRNDFRQGTWSSSTQQFFNSLVTTGNTNTSSSDDQTQQIRVLAAAVVTLQEAVNILEVQVSGLSTDVGLVPVRYEEESVSLADLGPWVQN
jgi:hypothetical protein